jgi:hypothetical protein
VTALKASARPTARAVAASAQQQQLRGVKTIDFAGTKEVVYGECFPSYSNPVRKLIISQRERTGLQPSSRYLLPDNCSSII